MRTHLGCTGRIDLGHISEGTQTRLEEVKATWLEFAPEPPSLVVRHVQPDAVSAPREIAGELLDFLSQLSEEERRNVLGGALYYLDEQNGQYLRLRVASGGNLNVSWANPDYNGARRVLYQNQPTPVVFEPYQRLNGSVALKAAPGAVEEIRAAIEKPAGISPQGDYTLHLIREIVGLHLKDVNSSVIPLVETLLKLAAPGSLDGHIDVGSFRTGDLDDYCRFVFKEGKAWLLRPGLWEEARPEMATASHL